MQRSTLSILAVLAIFLATPVFAGDDEVETKGPVQNFSDTHVTVSNLTFALTEETVYKDGSQSDLAVGVVIEVEGKSVGGALTAEKITFEDEDNGGGGGGGDDDVKTTGEISSVSGDEFTVNAITFLITSNTQFDNGTRNDVKTGMTVKVEGTHNGAVIEALEVEFKSSDDDDPGDGDGGDDDDDEFEITGLIDAVDGSSVTVGGTVFMLTGKTTYRKISVDELAIGVRVEVTGDKNSEGGWDARTIKREDSSDDDDVLPDGVVDTGVLTGFEPYGFDDLLITLDDVRVYKVDDAAELFGRLGLKVSAEDLLVGMTLRIYFKPEGSDDPYLGEVFRLELVGMQTIIGTVESGPAPASGEGSLMVSGVTILFDDLTELKNAPAGVSNPGDLKPGTKVLVLATPLSDGSFLANRIVVNPSSDDDGYEKSEKGVVSGVSLTPAGVLSAFSLNGKTYNVTSSTRFRVKSFGGSFPSGDFVTGLIVKVQSNGDVATTVLIYLPITKVVGQVQAFGPNSITVAGTQYLVTPSTKMKGFTAGDFPKGIKIGRVVEMKVLSWPGGVFVASEIENDDNDETEIQGQITDKKAVEGGLELTISGVVVFVNAATEIHDASGSAGMDALQIGIVVKAEGSLDDQSRLIARELRIY